MPDGSGVDGERRTSSWRRPHPATIGARLALLLLVGVLVVLATGDSGMVFWALLLAVTTVPAVLAPRHRILGPLTRFGEVVIICLAADVIVGRSADTGIALAAILPYLALPLVSAGLYLRRVETVLLIVLATGLLIGLGLTGHGIGREYYIGVLEWIVLAAMAASVAYALQLTVEERRDRPQPYAEATRLLTQLRSVARQLPGATLDPGST